MEFSKRLYDEMEKELGRIRLTEASELEIPRKSYQCAERFLQRLERYSASYNFTTEDERYGYHISTLPDFLEQRIYWYEMFYIIAYTPVGERESITAFLQQQIAHFNMYFWRNNLLYSHYRTGKLERRDPSDFAGFFHIESGGGASKGELLRRLGHKLAKIRAYERLINDLCREIEGPENSGTQREGFPKLVWTDTKASLIELIYSIHSKGSINYGHVDIKPMALGFGELLNVDLGNYYRVYHGFPARAEPTAYLDGLRSSLIERMQREQARRRDT